MGAVAKTSFNWEVNAEHPHEDGLRPMAEVKVERRSVLATTNLVADQSRTFRCDCGASFVVDFTATLQRRDAQGKLMKPEVVEN